MLILITLYGMYLLIACVVGHKDKAVENDEMQITFMTHFCSLNLLMYKL